MHQRSMIATLLAICAFSFSGTPVLAQEHGAPAKTQTPKATPAAAHAPADEQHAPAGESHSDSGHAAGGSNIFGGDLGNVFWTTVIFLIVVYVLGTKAWPPMLKALADREKSIRDALDTAKRDRDEAAKLMSDYKAQLERARVEATAIIEEGRRDGQAVRQRLQDDARKEADELVARARREVQLAADAAVKTIYDEAAQLAVEVAGQVVRKQFKADDHRQLVAESLERMKASKTASMN